MQLRLLKVVKSLFLSRDDFVGSRIRAGSRGKTVQYDTSLLQDRVIWGDRRLDKSGTRRVGCPCFDPLGVWGWWCFVLVGVC